MRFIVISAIVFWFSAGCSPDNRTEIVRTPTKVSSGSDGLVAARNVFKTKLRVTGSAPQDYEKEPVPENANEVQYTSGELKLKGLLSRDPGDGKKRPAVVFLHGGFAFGGGDWDDAARFTQFGFIVFAPMLRGENGNPGNYESFFGEVDDAIAAGKYVAALPNVDATNIFVAGHSVGGVLTTLVAMRPSPYKAAAAFDGYLDMETWVAHSPDSYIPYDRSSKEEIRVRNPMAFASSICCPLRLFSGEAKKINALFAERAHNAGKDCELVIVPGDHQQMVAPAVKKASEWFLEQSRK